MMKMIYAFRVRKKNEHTDPSTWTARSFGEDKSIFTVLKNRKLVLYCLRKVVEAWFCFVV